MDLSGNPIVQLGVATEEFAAAAMKPIPNRFVADVQRHVRHPTC